MTDPRTTAERLVRRFARETNLLVAGRAFRVDGTDAVYSAGLVVPTAEFLARVRY